MDQLPLRCLVFLQVIKVNKASSLLMLALVQAFGGSVQQPKILKLMLGYLQAES